MRLAEVLRQVDGLTKRFVHYLEAQGHIAPARIEKRRIARRDYSAEDVRRIAALWAYYRRGFSVQAAVDIVDRADRVYAYVLFNVPVRRRAATLDLLRRFDQVHEASVVYGEAEDLIVKLRAPDDGDIFAVLDAVLREGAISGVPLILRVATRVIEPDGGRGGECGMKAYVLIKASAKRIEDVLAAIRDLEGVVEASVVYGESDVICRVEVPDQPRLDRLVMRDLHAIAAVESTRTFICVTDMDWRRQDAAV